MDVDLRAVGVGWAGAALQDDNLRSWLPAVPRF